MEKLYQYTLVDLLDKLTIEESRSVMRSNLDEEIEKIVSDIDVIVNELDFQVDFCFLRRLILLAIVNLQVWYLDKSDPSELDYAQDLNNGIRNHIKNILMRETGEWSRGRERFVIGGSNKWYSAICKELQNDRQ